MTRRRRFEKWMQDLELGENPDKARILGQIVAECYMKGFEEGLFTIETEVLDVSEAKFVGQQLGKLTEWYLEELPD